MKLNSYNSYKKYFEKLVEKERKEEMDSHYREISKLSGEKRERLGRAILGLSGKDEGRGLGGTHIVKFGRKKDLSKTKISVGDLVIVSSSNPSGKEPQATVVEMTSNSLSLAFPNKPPSYVYKKNLRIDLFANDITFQRIFTALDKIEHNSLVKKVLLNRSKPNLSNEDVVEDFFNKRLNFSQREAVENSLLSDTFYLLHGPPGTGKTTTLTEIALQHVQRGYKVLVTADSNVAVDNIIEKLARFDVRVLRIGNPARLNRRVISHSLDYRISKSQRYNQAQKKWKEIERLKDQQKNFTKPSPSNRRGFKDREIIKMSETNKSSRGLSTKQVRSMAKWLAYQENISEIVNSAKKLEEEAIIEEIENSDVIVTTNSSSGSEVLDTYLGRRKDLFDLVLIDEATQAIEPANLIPLSRGKKFILAGDHKQLPPTVISRDAQELQYSLFERLNDTYSDSVKSLLSLQYRMLPSIVKFPNRQFYSNELKTSKSASTQSITKIYRKNPKDNEGSWIKNSLSSQNPFIFLDTSNLEDKWDYLPKGSTSFLNERESDLVVDLVKGLLDRGVASTELGVISPYDNQVDLIIRKLGKSLEEIEVKTIDGFQGREKEIIIISLVRSNSNQNIGFLTDLRRLNVGITRPRKKLIIIGDSETLSKNKIYKKLINDSTKILI